MCAAVRQHACLYLYACPSYATDTANSAYFLDGCLAAFDAAGEWTADADGHLLVRLPASLAAEPIGNVRLTGKVQTYALVFKSCPALTLRGLHFRATTIFV